MKSRTLRTRILAILTLFGAVQAQAADNMASIAITPATGVVTLTPRWAIGPNQAGFHHMSQDLGLTGSVANNFYSIKSSTIPAGGDILAFNFYVAGSGSATPHADIGSKLTPDSYSALTSADPDVGYGPVNLYLIHHKGTTDYFTAIIPGSATASAVTDEKPMSGPGGPGTVTGVSGYFGLTFSAANLGYGLNNFYYLRTDPVTGSTKFGTLAPALLGSSADQFDLGGGGHKALAFTGSDIGYGVNKMYYLRLDPITGFTILGMLDPALAGVRHTSDIANLGSVYSTLAFEANDLGFGASTFYTTGTINSTWQSVSFAAIADRTINQGSFTVAPSASSALPIVLTVVPGSTGAATISSPVGGVFTITPTSPGIVTLQATQVGAVNPIPYESNMLRQSFSVTGIGMPVITNSPLAAAGTVGTGFSFTIAASNSPSGYTASPLPAGLVLDTGTGAITGTPSAAGVTFVALGATNGIGTGIATLTITIATAGVAPIITGPVTAPATVGASFANYQIVATSQPTVFAASGLPPGLTINTATGAISGTPTTAGVFVAPLSAINNFGTGTTNLTITVAAAGIAPIVTSATTASGAIGTLFVTYQVAATGLPTGYSATGLPAGLTIDALTGFINGTPTSSGTSVATIRASNSAGVGSAVLTITVAPASSLPIVTSSANVGGNVGAAFVTYQIMATGNPTSFSANGLPPGIVLNSVTGRITGTPTATGNYRTFIYVTTPIGVGSQTLDIAVAPGITAQPVANSAVAVGAGATFTVIATTGGNSISYQWKKDGVDVPGANAATLVLSNVQPASVGFYTVVVSSWGTSTVSVPASLGISFSGQTAGAVTVVASNIQHPNGNIYDQVMLTGATGSVKANPGKIVRLSYVDLSDDIVQVEMSGAGVLTVKLDNSSGPAAPINYDQPGILYMKGHASIAITGADDTTNVAVFSVGRSNALNQTLFRAGTVYDGYADLALVTIATTDGHFGSLYSGNASYSRGSGMTGIYAPGARFSGVVYAEDIAGAGSANAVLVLGSGADVRITGGDLFQDNGAAVEVSGMTRMQFTAGASSHGLMLPVQANRARLMTNGVDVTAQLVP